MVERQDARLDRVFHALSDSTRRAMLASLILREHNIGELAEPFDMSFAAASKHVKVLESAGLVRREVRGRTHFCRIEPAMLKTVDEWLQEYRTLWEARFDRLEEYLRKIQGKEKTDGRNKK